MHYLLPARFKKPFFAALSIAAGLLLVPAGWVAALVVYGLALHFAVAIRRPWPRRAVVAVLSLGAIAVRAKLEPGYPVPDDFWDYFGAFFMFRGLLYLKDHEAETRSVTEALSYFVMAPAFAFKIFPIVDYRTFRRTYLLRPQHVTARAGVESILRGALQLLFFRLVLATLFVPPEQVRHLGHFFLFSFCAFCSLAKVTGGYHVAVGMLQLFGFDLPRPANFYFLSSSFLDYWNRSNIYWKNFMLKNVYLPAFFRLQRLGRTWAAVAAGTLVFAATWFLHGALRFWFTGQLQLTPVRSIYWTIMGAGAIWSLAGVHAESSADRFDRWLLVKVPLTFVALSVLWGFGSMPTLRDWLQLVARAL